MFLFLFLSAHNIMSVSVFSASFSSDICIFSNEKELDSPEKVKIEWRMQ